MPPTWSSLCARPSRWLHSIRDYKKLQSSQASDWLRFRRRPTPLGFEFGSDCSRGYCLEMICADFLAGANLEDGNPDVLLHSLSRFVKFLPGQQRAAFLENLTEKAS
jgi:hypothetical protein